MTISPFKLERYFAKYEFSVKYLLSASDCDGLNQSQLLSLANKSSKKLWDNLSLGYTESTGSSLLRKEITKLYKGINPEQILVAAPEEGIYIAMNTILRKGDHIIVTFPGYQSLYEIAKSLGCEVTCWEPEEDKNWFFNPEFLEKNIRKNTKMIVVNFPHNPTGFLPSVSDFKKITDTAKKHGVYLFSDEMYRFLEYETKDRLPSAVEIYDKAIILFGMSKTFGLPGLRIGWLITKDKKLLNEFAAFKDYTTICSSAPSEMLAIIALQNKDTIIKPILKRIERNLKYLDKFLLKHADKFSWVRPRSGTIGLIRLNSHQSSDQFCKEIVDKFGIMLLPSTVYEFGNSHFRIGFGRENFPEALDKLNLVLS